MDSSVDIYGFSSMSSRTTGNFTKKRLEEGNGRSSTTEECDSTTEPANLKIQFKIGEDVFYQEETGQNVLGTVALVQGKKVKIIFMDETEKWAHISKVKKISFSLNEDDDEDKNILTPFASHGTLIQQPTVEGGITSASKKKVKGDINGQTAPKENLQVTCGSCGTQKTIASKKALEFSPYTQHQYNCRKCINKSKTSKNNGVPLPLSAHYLAAARGRPKGTDNGTMPVSKGILDQGMANGIFRQENDICLHCRTQIIEKVSLHCTMCDRPCHPSCLALTPPPLPGDVFWSIICHTCGTQKPDGSPENDSQKLYSSRRSISCWSDVAYLLLSCLGCKYSNGKFFDLDEQIIPFWEENVSRLHLPRQYKTAESMERRKLLLLALNNANLRFFNDETSKDKPLWAIKDHTYKGLNVVIKPPLVAGGRAVTAAGFPISVRTSNPEAASAAMTNIAQTIAANKANSVPIPKNSPSHVPSKSNATAKTSGAGSIVSSGPVGRKLAKLPEQPPVAKKSGSEVNPGVQRSKFNDIWPQPRFAKTTFLADLPKSGPNNILGSRGVEEMPTISSNSQQFSNAVGNRIQTPVTQQSSHHKHTISPGGSARVSAMVISSTSSPSMGVTTPEVTSKTNCGSYPVRKNGSPMLNKSIRVEPVERKKETDILAQQPVVKPYRSFDGESCRKMEHELIRESPGFNNTAGCQPKLSIKRKLSTSKLVESSSSSICKVLDGQEVSSETKKLKMNLPNSTDVTPQRVPSPSKPPDLNTTKGSNQAKSPLQKLADLSRTGLTFTCSPPAETSVPGVAPGDERSRATANDSNNVDVVRQLSMEKYENPLSTPVKNSNGATTSAIVEVGKLTATIPQADDNTKDKTNNVTTSPRAFKLASVSSLGTSKTSPIVERRVARPVRTKRSVVTNAQVEKQSNESNELTGKPTAGKKVNAKGTAAAAALVAKASRGRPKKLYKMALRKPSGGMAYNIGQFNGPVINKTNEISPGSTINESDYTWNSSTINDLLEYGQGYRLECLPKCPEKKKDIVDAAVKYFKEEVTPRPPSYWSTSSKLNHSKKPSNQKSRKDLKNVDSYYICGSRITENGVQYQVVWRDGYGFEYSSDEEEELGVDLAQESYMWFGDSANLERFFDDMPVTVDDETGPCDSDETDSSSSNSKHNDNESDNMDVEEQRVGTTSTATTFASINTVYSSSSVKKEPVSAENSPVKGRSWADISAVSAHPAKSTVMRMEPDFIDLTDSP